MQYMTIQLLSPSSFVANYKLPFTLSQIEVRLSGVRNAGVSQSHLVQFGE